MSKCNLYQETHPNTKKPTTPYANGNLGPDMGHIYGGFEQVNGTQIHPS